MLDHPQRPAALPVRIRHVDSLRAVAAGLVMWAHFAQTLAPVAGVDPGFLGFLSSLPRAIDLGRLGVVVFFAVSGFVIFRGFGTSRAGAGRRFVVKRFCRLYPVYWASIIGAVLEWWLLRSQPVTWHILAANATMIPAFLGSPYLIGVYWTLEIELLFYALCLGLYWARWLEKRALLTALVIGLAALPRLLRQIDRGAGTHWGLSIDHSAFVLSLAVMFWGALFRLVYDETHGFRQGIFTNPSALLVAALALVLMDVPDPNVKWVLLGLRAGPMPGHLSVVCGLVIFALWVAWLRIDNFFITFLGVISYPLYLFHQLVADLIRQLLVSSSTLRSWHLPFWVVFLVCAFLSIAIALAMHGWVERPAIAQGKRWAGSRPASSDLPEGESAVRPVG